jgi:hypothetical protein
MVNRIFLVRYLKLTKDLWKNCIMLFWMSIFFLNEQRSLVKIAVDFFECQFFFMIYSKAFLKGRKENWNFKRFYKNRKKIFSENFNQFLNVNFFYLDFCLFCEYRMSIFVNYLPYNWKGKIIAIELNQFLCEEM